MPRGKLGQQERGELKGAKAPDLTAFTKDGEYWAKAHLASLSISSFWQAGESLAHSFAEPFSESSCLLAGPSLNQNKLTP